MAEDCCCAEAADLSQLLDPAVPDRRVRPLMDRAAALTRSLAGDRGFIWAAIGLDSTPCPMGCSFCSHAARWGISEAAPPLTDDEAVALSGELADGGADFVVLRTTQFYGIDHLVDLGRRVRMRIGSEVHLVVNTGESDADGVRRLAAAGFDTAYHVVRLREGVDTSHTVAQRVATIEAIRAAGMDLQYLVEPLGPEHAADEILTEARRAHEIGASGTGVMARVPVLGTPLAHRGQVADAWLTRVAAATRLVYPDGGPHLCVHPPVPSAFGSGANTVVVEMAAIPRDVGGNAGAWRGFDLTAARELLRRRGFTPRAIERTG